MRLGADAIVFSRHLNNGYVSKSEYNDMLVKATCFLLYWQSQSLLHLQERSIFINYLHPEGNAYSDEFIYVLYMSNLGFLLIWSFQKGSKGGPLPGKRYNILLRFTKNGKSQPLDHFLEVHTYLMHPSSSAIFKFFSPTS